jgi:hypothetical protein
MEFLHNTVPQCISPFYLWLPTNHLTKGRDLRVEPAGGLDDHRMDRRNGLGVYG